MNLFFPGQDRLIGIIKNRVNGATEETGQGKDRNTWRACCCNRRQM